MSNENGTVAVRFVKPNGAFMPGDVAGFDHAIAETLKKKGVAVDPNEKVAAAVGDGQTAVPEGDGKSPEPPKGTSNPDDVEIPENWESEHHLQLIRIAKLLVPDEKSINKERAIEIITTEIERRKANEQ